VVGSEKQAAIVMVFLQYCLLEVSACIPLRTLDTICKVRLFYPESEFVNSYTKSRGSLNWEVSFHKHLPLSPGGQGVIPGHH